MKSKEVLLAGMFAVSLLVLLIGVLIGSRAPPPLTLGGVPPGSILAAQMPAGGAQGRLDYHPPVP